MTGGRPAMATTKTSIKKAFDTQEDLKNRREHCAPAAGVLASLGSGPGQQVRIHRNDEFALYTVSELLHETTDVGRAHGSRRPPAARTSDGGVRGRAGHQGRRSGPVRRRTPEMPASWSSGSTTMAPRRTSSPSPPTVATSSRTPTSRPSGWPSASARSWPAPGGPRAGGPTAAPSSAGTSRPPTSTRSASPCSAR